MKVEKKRMDEYLKSIRSFNCPLCGSNNWTVSDTVFQALEFDIDGLRLGGASVPIIPISCMKCGNTLFINALISGLIDRPEDKNDGRDENKSTE